MTAFHERPYEVFVIKTTEDARELWKWEHWSAWAKALSPFTIGPRGKALLRCNQFSGARGEMVRFGRLSWDEKSHQRWAHDAPTNGDVCKGWKFLSVEAWAPSWNTCVAENLAPDFFCSMTNRNVHRHPMQSSGVLIVCAIPSSQSEAKILDLATTLGMLADSIPSCVVARKTRPWGIASSPGSASFTYAIQDMTESVFSDAGNSHARPFDEDTVASTWQFIKKPTRQPGAAG